MYLALSRVNSHDVNSRQHNYSKQNISKTIYIEYGAHALQWPSELIKKVRGQALVQKVILSTLLDYFFLKIED